MLNEGSSCGHIITINFSLLHSVSMTHLSIFIEAVDPKYITKRCVFLPYPGQKKRYLCGCAHLWWNYHSRRKPQETCWTAFQSTVLTFFISATGMFRDEDGGQSATKMLLSTPPKSRGNVAPPCQGKKTFHLFSKCFFPQLFFTVKGKYYRKSYIIWHLKVTAVQ